MQRRCTRQPMSPSRPRYVAPVRARPHLGPVDGELEAAPAADGRRGEQAEVRERAGEHEVVVAPVPQQMPEHADAEHERRQDPPPAVGVELHPRAGRDDPDARHLARLGPPPLPQRQVRHLVPLGGETFGEIPVEALGPADRVRVEAVVDDADPHVGRGQ